MKIFACIYSILFSSLFCLGQVQFEAKNGLVSNESYSKKISTDFNYLILGENSPQQGISAILNEKKSNIKISGLLFSKKIGVLSVEADLSASNGIYFFNQDNGSEKGKVTFNYFRPIKSWSEFYPLDKLTRTSSKLEILELIAKTKNEYEGLRILMDSIGAINGEFKKIEFFEKDRDVDIAYQKLRKIAEKYIHSDDSKGFYKIPKEIFDNTPYLKKKNKDDPIEIVIIKAGVKSKDVIIENINNLNINKVIEDYIAKKHFILHELENEINKKELENVKSKWAGNHIFFFGFSPFYERQSFKRFSFDETQTFKDMFTNERGNVYGITLSLNYNLQKGQGSKNLFKPQNFFARVSATLARASNISNFNNTTLDITTPLGNDVNGNPITFSSSDNAFIGDNVYEYGFSREFNLDLYYYPFSIPVGIFGVLGYERIVFNRGSSIDDKELYPMRLGFLFNLTNKSKDKPKVTIQAFLDRSNLNLSPNGQDDDLRFGLGIGLPFNF